MKSNLPDGVTNKMVEDQCGEPCEECGGEGVVMAFVEGEHEEIDCRVCGGNGEKFKPTRDEMREYYGYEDHT